MTTVLHIARRRSTILDYLRDGPLDKRDLLDRVATSRSTVDRAIEELLDHGMVRVADGGYETTLAGVLALERSRAFERDADALGTAAPALAPLWKEAEVDLGFLRGASAGLVAEADGVRLLAAFGSAIRNADWIRGVFPCITQPAQLETLHDRGTDGSDFEVVVSEPLFETLSSTFPGWLRDVALEGSGRVAVGPVPEYALFVRGTGHGREAFMLTYDDGRPHGILRNDGEAAAWADERIETIRTNATERRDRIRELDGSAGFSGVGDATPPFGETSAVADGRLDDEAGDDGPLGSGYAIDDGKLRTPAFGADEACTVAFWMRPTAVDGGWQILVKWDYLAVAFRRGELHGMVYDDDAGERRAYAAAPLEEVREDSWQHVAYSYDESRSRLYLDGDLVDETEDDYPLRIADIGAALGYHYRDRDTGVHEPTYEGRLYDARFYGDALSAEKIEQLVGTTDPTSVAWGAE